MIFSLVLILLHTTMLLQINYVHVNTGYIIMFYYKQRVYNLSTEVIITPLHVHIND